MEQIKYTCSSCGKEHVGWPAIAYDLPDDYSNLSPEDRESMAELVGDFCVITYPDQTDRYIRATLIQKVINHCEDLDYGFWVTLSEQSFEDYKANYKNDNHEATYFGWLGNVIPDYEFKESIPTTVITRSNNQRPEIVPHENFDHPFVRDYYRGISKKEAEKRINRIIRKPTRKQSWWKIWSFLLLISFLFVVSCNRIQSGDSLSSKDI